MPFVLRPLTQVRKNQKQNLLGKNKKPEAEAQMRDLQSYCMCRDPL